MPRAATATAAARERRAVLLLHRAMLHIVLRATHGLLRTSCAATSWYSFREASTPIVRLLLLLLLLLRLDCWYLCLCLRRCQEQLSLMLLVSPCMFMFIILLILRSRQAAYAYLCMGLIRVYRPR